jgi:epoxyqueuosine reductase
LSSIELNQFVRQTADKLGFSKIGIAPAIFNPLSEQKLSSWLNQNHHATMHWMRNRSSERSNILNYYPDAKSIISVGLNYFTGISSNQKDVGKISNYAWGDDYHDIIKPRLYKLLSKIKFMDQKIDGVICVDTSPLMEKDWAQKAGLGWIGKHTNLITQDFGSWIFLGELILNVELEYDAPFSEDLCGTCTACLDACPTNAFPEPYVLDSSKCISYLTIEHKGNLPNEMGSKLSGWIYGCDICQEVCPWNIKFSQNSQEEAFQPRSNLNNRTIQEWKQLSEVEYRKLFKGSPIKRTKYSGLKRNITHNNL